MSRALIVIAHPDQRSLTHFVAAELETAFASQGISSEVADLAAEDFDPRFTRDDRSSYQGLRAIPDDVTAEQERIDRADHLILVFPVYWWSMPALLKGWVDRVFVNGWAFELTEGGSVAPKLAGLTIHLVPLAGSDASAYDRHGYRASIKAQIEHGVIDFCGARRGSMRYLYDSETKPQAVITDEVSLLARDIAEGARESLSEATAAKL
ncbi:NAD(P)H-dependent oxidoreductase [Nesterenkonia lutea]|uniref:NAD(P)H dehydrogenase (Quinone) n=1 Tax=Nesterenkonia lutea TaxID=272919 RepID=A0ABR9JDG7_9MICC|nr:NAD(P)H-dependent oxidoreductase [Nesterenkonia lutea]MBE1523968.1 NAD(P)H dehydrogenase (quinone) [Nesterenkonia lutea]